MPIYDTRAIKVYVAKMIEAGPRGTQANLARALDMPVPTVNKWAQRQNCPAPAHWAGIEKFFKLEPDTLARIGGITLAKKNDVETVILGAEELTEDQRDALIRVYYQFIGEAGWRAEPRPHPAAS